MEENLRSRVWKERLEALKSISWNEPSENTQTLVEMLSTEKNAVVLAEVVNAIGQNCSSMTGSDNVIFSSSFRCTPSEMATQLITLHSQKSKKLCDHVDSVLDQLFPRVGVDLPRENSQVMMEPLAHVSPKVRIAALAWYKRNAAKDPKASQYIERQPSTLYERMLELIGDPNESVREAASSCLHAALKHSSQDDVAFPETTSPNLPRFRTWLEAALSPTEFGSLQSQWEFLRSESNDSASKPRITMKQHKRVGKRGLSEHSEPAELPQVLVAGGHAEELPPDDEVQREFEVLFQGSDPTSSTLIVTDERLIKHQSRGKHPERPMRLVSIVQRLNKGGAGSRCEVRRPAPVPNDDVLLCHSQQHVDALQGTTRDQKEPSDAGVEGNIPTDTYWCEDTEMCAKLSCGGVVDAVTAVATGEKKNAIAIVRPPGHHAGRNSISGFCWINNVAVAARTAQRDHGVTRVAILDWDVHHGNGTQDIFEDDPTVLYISIHRGNFYPWTGELAEVGKDKASACTLNIPLAEEMVANREFVQCLDEIVIPALTRFFGGEKGLLIVSAGFDAVEGDPLGQTHVSPDCFGLLSSKLMEFMQGKLVLALEGGYNVDQLALCVESCISALLGSGTHLTFSETLNEKSARSLEEVANFHSQKWDERNQVIGAT